MLILCYIPITIYNYIIYNYVDEVAYATALDVFIIICSILVFFALAEFALLSFLDVYIRKAKCQKEF